MMKKIINVLAFLIAVLIAASCEKYIEFSGEESEPRLTVSALAKAGEPFSAYVSSSLFFLDSDGIEAFVKDLDVSRGVVQVTVNGESGPVAMRCMPEKVDGALLYGCDYVPRPGDRIVLEAEFPGFDPVRAETRVPYPPRFEITSLKPGGADEDMEMTIRLSDDGSYEKYYFLAPKRVMPSPWTEEPAEVFCRFNSDDIVFRNVAMGVFEIYDPGAGAFDETGLSRRPACGRGQILRGTPYGDRKPVLVRHFVRTDEERFQYLRGRGHAVFQRNRRIRCPLRVGIGPNRC